MELTPGTVIDKLQVVELLGQGAMAWVYLVRHVHLDAPYALKVLQVHDPVISERLLTEGRVQASLRHPNVVGVTDVIRVDDRPGLVLEFVDGPTLESFIQDYGPLPLAEVDHIALSIGKGLRAAHQAGHLHRDLKPANILMDYLDDQWIPKIADFGLAKLVYGDGDVSTTRTGQILGSPTFMAPEQFRDARGVDERADVFALGAVCYELATQVRCFDGPDVVQVLTRVAAGAFVPVRDLRADLPMRIVSAIHGALVVDPAQRIPDVDTFMKVWRGEMAFEANAHDVTSSVIGLLGAEPALLSGTQPAVRRRPEVEPMAARAPVLGLGGTLLVLLGLGLVGIGSLSAGFTVVYALGLYLRTDGGEAPTVPVEPTRPIGPVAPAAPAAPVPAAAPVAPTTEPAPPAPSPSPSPARPALSPVERPPAPVEPSPAPPPPVPVPEPPPVPSGGAVYGPVLLANELPPYAPVRACLETAEAAGTLSRGQVLMATLQVGTDGTIVRVLLDEPYDRGDLLECMRSALASFQFSAAPPTPKRERFPFRL